MTPTAYIASCAVQGSRSTMRGARYWSQLTNTWANLSAPNTTGATVNPMRSSQKDWNTGLCQSARAASAGAPVVAIGRVSVVAIASLLLLSDSVIDVRTAARFRQLWY